MDANKFQQFCQEHAVVVRNSDASARNGRNKSYDDNPTHGLAVVALRAKPETCDHCSKQCDDRIIRTWQWRDGDWRGHCQGCNRQKQPGSQTFGNPQEVERLKRRYERIREQERNQPQQSELQSPRVEHDPTVDFVVEVIVQENHESVIKEFVRHQVVVQDWSNDAQDSDSEVRTG